MLIICTLLLLHFRRKDICRAGGGEGGGGESRAANSDRGLVLGVGGSRRTGSRARPRRAFFSDSDSNSDSDEAFQILRKLSLAHVEFFCVLVQQLWSELVCNYSAKAANWVSSCSSLSQNLLYSRFCFRVKIVYNYGLWQISNCDTLGLYLRALAVNYPAMTQPVPFLSFCRGICSTSPTPLIKNTTQCP
jgi:hypothetical protein